VFNKYIKISAIALLIALIAGFATNPGSRDYFRFKMGNYDINGETASIKDSIKLFSSSMAGFYASGGNTAGLRMFPAEMLIKRRIFMDISINRDSGLLLVLDRDRSDVKQVTFVDPAHAIAIVEENWVNQYQDPATRRPVSGKKANIITVRYFFKKIWSKWIVLEYEVYDRNDNIPSVPKDRFVRW